MYTFSNLSINNASTHSLAPVAEIHSLKYHPRTYKALEFAWRRRRKRRRRRRIYSYSEIL
jgi:accessory gene regulator protein AgrB